MSHSINFPQWSKPLFKPKRYKVVYGGRGSGKSITVADALIAKAMTEKTIIICGREFQESIKDSVHSLLKNRINDHGLADWFEIQRDKIICTATGTEFIFKGLRHNIESIKSVYGIGYLWIEEGSTISRESWETIKPTVREEGSEIWITFNPRFESDPIYNDFVTNQHPDAFVMKVNWSDNKHFPKVLNDERLHALKFNTDTYPHIWEGELLTHTKAQILNGKWRVADFEPQADWDGAYFGMDHGFATDPMTLVKCWIADRTLYIEKERFGHGIEIADMVEFVEGMPEAVNHSIRADSARPEINSHLRNAGLNVVSVEKWAGSVEDGITFLRSFDEIVIHSSCTHIIEEARLWSYKTDRLTGDIMPQVVDDYNHGWDAVRYALQPLIKQEPAFIMEFA
jgi:phage terminase large subunit